MDSADSVLEKCKQKVKLLMEFYTTCKHIHWSHPSVLDFCVAVENVLSFGAKKEVKRVGHRDTDKPASLKILAALGQTNPLCGEVFQQCYHLVHKKQASKNTPMVSGQHKSYLVSTQSVLEYGILWIRACLIEKKLSETIEVFITNAQSYYSCHSVLADEVNADIFSFLLIGPCSIRLTQLKPVDAPPSASPTELVEKMKVLASRCPKFNPVSSYVWDHMESLYQHSSSMCLFGKNNTVIVMHGKELNGYLSLHQENMDVILKWIPSALLAVDDPSTAAPCDASEIIELCLSINISKEITHLHCHRNGEKAQLVMINYDGIAIVTVIFPHYSGVLTFLECLESGLLPKRCLQPPLFYLKNQPRTQRKNKSESDLSNRIVTVHPVPHKGSSSSLQLNIASPDPSITVPHNSIEGTSPSSDDVCSSGHIWNQVFTVWCGSQPVAKKSWPTDGKKSSILKGEIPGLAVIMPTPDQCVHAEKERETASNQTESDHKRNKAIQDFLQRKQKELSLSLIASYFYNWLSYCRHRSNLQKNVSHMLLTNPPYQLVGDSTSLTDDALQLLTDTDGKITNWGRFLSCVYSGGVEHLLRPKVWPLLLGVYPHDASSDEKKMIYQQNKSKYEELLREGKQMEEAFKATADERKRSDSVLFREMMEKMNKSSHKQTDNDESETKTESRSDRYMQELEIIDKDVNRCDRNYEYYKSETNLSKLRNIIACYCLDNLKEKGIFYAQGMTDLLAPLLVVIDDEVIAHSCFAKLMDKLIVNFPPKEGMQKKLTNMRNLTEALEPEFFESMQQPDFLFCTKWFLLAFKREFSYDDIFRLWETMWAAEHLVTNCFMEFFALSLLRKYISTIMHQRMGTAEMFILFGEMESQQHNGEFESILRQTFSLIAQTQSNLANE